MYGTLEETPIAQRALAEDRVIEVSDDLEREVPERYARFAGITTLTCTPVSAGGRWLGVIFADRGGGRFELTDAERHSMWTLGKTAALAASVAHRDQPAGPRAGCCRRASTSRARSTSASCSGCSASRSCSARSAS